MAEIPRRDHGRARRYHRGRPGNAWQCTYDAGTACGRPSRTRAGPTPTRALTLRLGGAAQAGCIPRPSLFRSQQGQNVTFVQPRAWIGAWPAIDPEQALQEILRRFLAAYGPATIDEFARWFGLEPSKAKKLFRSLGDEASLVDVEGWQAYALRSSTEAMRERAPSNSVRLLPHFDPYTIAVARHAEYLLPPAEKPRVYRSQGWISPVVLVDGRIAGVWEYEKQRGQLVVTGSMFAAPTSEVRDGIEAEARRLGGFLDTPIRLVYA